MGQLAGKVVIVTGAGRGIGKAISQLFAQEGAKVAMISRTKATLDKAVSEIVDGGGVAIGIPCDVSKRESVLKSVQTTLDVFGTVDVLINNAHDLGTSMHGSILTTTVDTMQEQFSSGVFSTLHFMQACYSHLKKNKGAVVNFASGAGINGVENHVPYACAKECVRAITRSAAREWGPDKIRVNSICPVTMTDSLRDAIDTPIVKKVLEKVPLGPPGEPMDEIAPVALFLSTSASKYMTGANLMVNGGNLLDAAR